MSDKRLHLVRHGEVHNPERVLYGRLPGFRLSERGELMAQKAAEDVLNDDRPIARLIASPLERTQQSAHPFRTATGLSLDLDERVIEPTNWFEGRVNSGKKAAFRDPRNWHKLVNPARPSWGEPYRDIAKRMNDAMRDAWHSTDTGDIVIVSHQAPIWLTHLDVARKPLMHDPRKRRCDLSSVTSFELRGDTWHEVEYRSPASDLIEAAQDVGAV